MQIHFGFGDLRFRVWGVHSRKTVVNSATRISRLPRMYSIMQGFVHFG